MRRRFIRLGIDVLILSSLAGIPAIAADTPAAPAIIAADQQSFDKWKAELVKNRKEKWLPLAGLFWLKPGENSFGADKDNAIVFPKGPGHAGWFIRQGKDVSVKLAPGVQATVAGKPVTGGKMEPDISKNVTIVEMGGLRFHLIVRGERVGIRLKDLESEAVRSYRGPDFFPLNMNYRVIAKWEPAQGNRTMDVPNVLGDVTPTPVSGAAVFKLNGQEFRLTDLSEDPKTSLFFVFNDFTSKTETYPGGRFLDAEPPANGTVVLDFNRAYSPPCSVTPYATCPLAPKENRLALALPVGEKYDHKSGHH
jgi:uncharacterized protein